MGKPVAMGLVASKAKQCMILVSPAGCGKSTICETIQQVVQPTHTLDSVTRSALREYNDEFNDYRGLVVVDDLGKIDTAYSRLASVVTFCELCYSHYIEKATVQGKVEIRNFHGSSILNTQPVILKTIVPTHEWESNIGDKTLRYYHMYRALHPNATKPELLLQQPLGLDDVARTIPDCPESEEVLSIALVQWSRSRVAEHATTLLRSTAAWAQRTVPTQDDAAVLAELMRPMAAERWTIRKEGFEDQRYLESDVLCLATEFSTYGHFGLDNIQLNYKLSESTAYGLMAKYNRYWKLGSKSPTVYIPADDMLEMLIQCGSTERGK